MTIDKTSHKISPYFAPEEGVGHIQISSFQEPQFSSPKDAYFFTLFLKGGEFCFIFLKSSHFLNTSDWWCVVVVRIYICLWCFSCFDNKNPKQEKIWMFLSIFQQQQQQKPLSPAAKASDNMSHTPTTTRFTSSLRHRHRLSVSTTSGLVWLDGSFTTSSEMKRFIYFLNKSLFNA